MMTHNVELSFLNNLHLKKSSISPLQTKKADSQSAFLVGVKLFLYYLFTDDIDAV